LHSDKNQVPVGLFFVGGPNAHNKPKIADSGNFERK